MSVRAVPLRRLAVDGRDPLVVEGTDAHQPDLRQLARQRDGTGDPFRIRVELEPHRPERLLAAREVGVVGPGGHELGLLPPSVGEELHAGLQLLASLEPPYVLSCEALAWHAHGRPDGDLRLTLYLDLDEIGRLTG
ncbi:hypothetical protein [Egicoccus sp. AB-alg6-2]|uniref:hypothetical protein n=1 Tax=Egicoccus sp. AB-alg6-2 TaxID=3242692 RepID=UPI00359E21C6